MAITIDPAESVDLGPVRTRTLVGRWILFGVLCLLPLGTMIAGLQVLSRGQPVEGILLLALGGGMLTAVEASRRHAFKLNRNGFVIVSHGRLTIDHPPLFKSPLTIPLEQIRAGALSRPSIGSSGAPEPPRFPVLGGSPGTRFFADPTSVRRLMPEAGYPNALLVFSRPVVAPRVRRKQDGGPRSGEQMAALSLTVSDPDAIEGLFARAGLRDHLRADDLEAIRGIEAEKARGRRRIARASHPRDPGIPRDWGLGGFAVLAIALTGCGVALFLDIRTDDVPTFGPSMRPTIAAGGVIRVDEAAYRDAGPGRGEIVALQSPRAFSQFVPCAEPHPASAPCPVPPSGGYSVMRLVKRVVGLAGDRIAFAGDGGLILNGRRVAELYITPCKVPCGLPDSITVPTGHIFVAGDNRGRSTDSRVFGPMPVGAVDGRVLVGRG